MQKTLSITGLLILSVLLGACARPQLSPGDTNPTHMGSGADRPGFQSGADLGDFGPGFGDDGDLQLRDGWGADEGERGFFESVFFDFDQSTIRPADRAMLDGVARHLRENPDHRLLVEGHCDWRGTAEYNLALGDRRARSVQDYLIQLGIDASRLDTLSKGDLEATVTDDRTQLQQDRRAELILRR